ncbi:MAG: hypothetical protein K6E22_08195 [Treponema sp.]|nr:hypothetical protein [Treponema sp.]
MTVADEWTVFLLTGPISNFRSAAEKLAEAIFEPKKILHTRYSKCVYRARGESEEAFFGAKTAGSQFFCCKYKTRSLP